MKESIPFNLHKSGATLRIENNSNLRSTPPKLHHLFSELYEALNIEQLGYFKIKAIELLYHIDQLTKNHGCDFKYNDKHQIQATKEIQTNMINPERDILLVQDASRATNIATQKFIDTLSL